MFSKHSHQGCSEKLPYYVIGSAIVVLVTILGLKSNTDNSSLTAEQVLRRRLPQNGECQCGPNDLNPCKVCKPEKDLFWRHVTEKHAAIQEERRKRSADHDGNVTYLNDEDEKDSVFNVRDYANMVKGEIFFISWKGVYEKYGFVPPRMSPGEIAGKAFKSMLRNDIRCYLRVGGECQVMIDEEEWVDGILEAILDEESEDPQYQVKLKDGATRCFSGKDVRYTPWIRRYLRNGTLYLLAVGSLATGILVGLFEETWSTLGFAITAVTAFLLAWFAFNYYKVKHMNDQASILPFVATAFTFVATTIFGSTLTVGITANKLYGETAGNLAFGGWFPFLLVSMILSVCAAWAYGSMLRNVDKWSRTYMWAGGLLGILALGGSSAVAVTICTMEIPDDFRCCEWAANICAGVLLAFILGSSLIYYVMNYYVGFEDLMGNKIWRNIGVIVAPLCAGSALTVGLLCMDATSVPFESTLMPGMSSGANIAIILSLSAVSVIFMMLTVFGPVLNPGCWRKPEPVVERL